MSDPQVRLDTDMDSKLQWAVEYDRARGEVWINTAFFGLTEPANRPEHADAVADIGAAAPVSTPAPGRQRP